MKKLIKTEDVINQRVQERDYTIKYRSEIE